MLHLTFIIMFRIVSGPLPLCPAMHLWVVLLKAKHMLWYLYSAVLLKP